MKGRSKTGRLFLKTFVSSACFFSSGRIIACLYNDDIGDSAKDQVINVLTKGRRMSVTNLRMLVGMGSNSQNLEAELRISLQTAVSVVDEKQFKGDPQNFMSVFKALIPKSF